MNSLPSLVKAEFCVLVPGGKYEDDPYSMVDGMLAKIPNVEKLRLSSHTIKVNYPAVVYYCDGWFIELCLVDCKASFLFLSQVVIHASFCL